MAMCPKRLEFKAGDNEFELAGLFGHRERSGRDLLHQRRVLLGGAVKLVDGLVHLLDAGTLLAAGRHDLPH